MSKDTINPKRWIFDETELNKLMQQAYDLGTQKTGKLPIIPNPVEIEKFINDMATKYDNDNDIRMYQGVIEVNGTARSIIGVLREFGNLIFNKQ